VGYRKGHLVGFSTDLVCSTTDKKMQVGSSKEWYLSDCLILNFLKLVYCIGYKWYYVFMFSVTNVM
jgi:hypothetical protein